jgi:hypothetical protein
MTDVLRCPQITPVPASLLGIDRTETFKSANGSTVSFTVHAPVVKPTVVNVSPCNGAAGCSDTANVAAAIATVKAAGGGTVQLGAGDFFFAAPAPGQPNVLLPAVSDFILAGAPYTGDIPLTHLYFQNTSPTVTAVGLAMFGSYRVLLRNFSIDWIMPNALPGVVTTVGGVQRLTLQNGPSYVPDPTHPPHVFSVTGFDLTNRTYTFKAGARPGVAGTFNPNFATDGLYYYSMAGSYFPENAEAIGWVPTGTGILFYLSGDLSIEGVRIYGGGGPGISYSGNSDGASTGLRISNTKITRKPDSLLAPGELPRYVSLVGDNDAVGVLGGILVESSEFAYMDDDIFAIGGGFAQQAASIISTSQFTVRQASQPILHAHGASDVFSFTDPVTMAQLGSAPSSGFTQTFSGGMWTLDVTLANPVPGLAPYVGGAPATLPFASEPLWGSPNFVLRNNCFHDTHGRLVIQAINGLIEHNTFGNTFFGPIAMTFFPSYAAEGPGAGNIIVRNNSFSNSNYGQTDTNWLGVPTFGEQTGVPSAVISVNAVANTGFFPIGGYPAQAIKIVHNFILNAPGLAILVAGVDGASVIDNTIVNVNAIPFLPGYDASYCGPNSKGIDVYSRDYVCLAKVAAQGSIMISHSNNVDISSKPNRFFGSSARLIFVDRSTVR